MVSKQTTQSLFMIMFPFFCESQKFTTFAPKPSINRAKTKFRLIICHVCLLPTLDCTWSWYLLSAGTLPHDPLPPATSSCVLIVPSFVSFQVLPLIIHQDTNIHMMQRQRKVTGLITVPIAVFVWCFISHCFQAFPTQWACVLGSLHNFCHCNQFCSPFPKIAWLTQSPIIPYLTIGFFKGYWKI